MGNVLPKSRLVKVEMMIALPISATYDQIEDWIAFECGRSGSMDGDNPLINYEPEAILRPVLTDLGRHLHEDVTDNQDGTHTIHQRVENHPAWGSRAIDTILAAHKEPSQT